MPRKVGRCLYPDATPDQDRRPRRHVDGDRDPLLTGMSPADGVVDQDREPLILIATILRETGETGVQTHFNSFLRFLKTKGVQAHVVTPFSANPALVYPVFAARKLIDCLNLTASVWWYRYWHFIFLKWALQSKLRCTDALTVYAQCPLSAKAALRVRFSTKQKVVLVIHFNISQADEWADKGKIVRGGAYFESIKRLEGDVIPKLDGIVYVSDFARHSLEERFPAVKNTLCEVIPNFMRKPEAVPSTPLAADLITIGTLENRKNQSFLLHVLAQARHKGKCYTLSIVGDGPDRTKLESLAEELGITDQVRFLGFRKQASDLMPEHKVYCHAAKLENCSVVLIEALAYGRPVIAAPVGGIPEIIRDGIEGAFWELDDPVRAADVLISLLDNPARYVAMSKAASKRFESKFEEYAVGAMLQKFLFAV
jgi:glycosyltransferase involved in cell wall biosynthesis